MHLNPIYLLICVLISANLIYPFSAYAQDAGYAGSSLNMGYSARGMAMANSMSAVTGEGVYPYYNPALAAISKSTRQTELSIAALKYDRFLQTAGIHLQLPPSAGLSFQIIHAGIKEIDGRSVSGYPTSMFDAADYQLSGNFGIRLSEKIYGGIGLKFSMADYHPDIDNATSFGMDLGLLYKSDHDLNLAVTVKDLFAGYNWNTQELYGLSQAQNTLNKFPARIIIGAAYEKKKWIISGEYEYLINNTEITIKELISDGLTPVYISRSESVTSTISRLRFGASSQLHERFTLRAGWGIPTMENAESWNVSAGFSIHLPFDMFQPSIDYAFVKEPYRVSDMHVFTLRLNL